MVSHHNQSFSTELRRRRCSTAQMCFFRILHIISDFRSSDVSDTENRDAENCEVRGLDVDLNISLRPPAEIKPVVPSLTAAGDDGENCVLEKNDRPALEEERATEHSEISHVGDQSSGIDCNGVSEEDQKDEGYLGLLIEAAQLIEEAEPDKEPPSNKTVPLTNKNVEASASAAKGGVKRKQQWWTAATEAEWYAEFENTSPMVKSKRGRNQVLPYKYRDSVVEPLVRWPPPSRHRSNSNVAVPSKPRSK